MKLVIVLLFLVVGTVVFHFASPWWFTPLASNWGAIDGTITITFWVTGIVFILVNLFLAYCVYKYRFKATTKSHYEPENKKLEVWLTVLTAIGVAAMLAPGLIVWAKFVDPPSAATEMEVVGQQWQWGFRLPGADGILGTADNRYVSPDNPLGVNPKDEHGQDDLIILDNEMAVPLDKPVQVLLRSRDVLHNFAVPQFRVKMDLVPGSVSQLWFTPTLVGKFDILCMELCGIAHYAMRGYVHVLAQDDYDAWLANQPTFAETQDGGKGDPVAGRAIYATCATCHGANGEGNVAMNAPNLSIQSEWYLRRQIKNYQDGLRGYHDDDAFGKQMAPMAQIMADPATLRNVTSYIASLDDINASDTIEGDLARGASYYVTCGACHGGKGEGNFALNAPRLAGQQDWYIKRQLQSFKAGMRGTHAEDSYGKQMILMSKMLANEQAMNDLVAYINTL